ncbi:MAG: Lrp/AsnC family transcriptional regulator [Rhizobiaceae bacterium]|nr:Lrp/AsnC family transcriptional regulator [Rhizobiaceae bacterium]|tara:strand:+ start:801 stop:1259 length:459 start_codon:yes stop_codon:yes gene_type:complete
MQIDERDRKLLNLLQQDCRLSNTELAEKVGMSSSACWRRVRALEEAGIIAGYSAIVEPRRLGLTFQAIVHVQLTRHDPAGLEAFKRAVSSRREVQDCFATTGQADYHMRVICADIDAYNHFLEDFLFQLPAVRSAQTNVVLKEIARAGTLAV